MPESDNVYNTHEKPSFSSIEASDLKNKISQILLKPVALVLSDDLAELSDAYMVALTETLMQQIEEESEVLSLQEEEAVAVNSGAKLLAVRLEYVRPMSGGVHVLRLEPPVEIEQVRQLTEWLAARDDVEYAEPDQPRRR